MLLKTGSKGIEVKKLQTLLGINVDGIFGNETSKAVKVWQKKNGLKADGIVGEKTWAALTKKKSLVSPKIIPALVPSKSKQTFNEIVSLIIDELEGGYYHPYMLNDGRLKTKNPAVYSTSGETMFGLDRSAGHDLFYSTPRKKNTVLEDVKLIEAGNYKYKNAASEKFWSLMDETNARDKWKWNYTGGSLNVQLKSLTGEIMKPYFDLLSEKYLKLNRSIVESDARLTFHFAYACWNGPGWFKKFANDINNAISNGQTNKEKLVEVALYSRNREGLKPGSSPNALIVQAGKKIEGLFSKMK
ncbi:hypothetical protein BH09BAC5_BH09BAC5_28010 [soil metagenome]